MSKFPVISADCDSTIGWLWSSRTLNSRRLHHQYFTGLSFNSLYCVMIDREWKLKEDSVAWDTFECVFSRCCSALSDSGERLSHSRKSLQELQSLQEEGKTPPSWAWAVWFRRVRWLHQQNHGVLHHCGRWNQLCCAEHSAGLFYQKWFPSILPSQHEIQINPIYFVNAHCRSYNFHNSIKILYYASK